MAKTAKRKRMPYISERPYVRVSDVIATRTKDGYRIEVPRLFTFNISRLRHSDMMFWYWREQEIALSTVREFKELAAAHVNELIQLAK